MIPDAEHAAVLRNAQREGWRAFTEVNQGSAEFKSPIQAAIERAIEILSRSTKHFVEVDGNGWAIEHPLPCRDLGSLLLCPLHIAVEEDFRALHGWLPGRYSVSLNSLGGLETEWQS